MQKNPLPVFLLITYLVFFTLLGLQPYSRSVWIAENIPIVLIVTTLIFLYGRKIRFSNTAYLLMSCLVFMHTLGGHYTFERVPFDWFNNLFGFKRNMYDRVAHFTVGFYAFAVAELSFVSGSIRKKWLACLLGLFAITTVAAVYEIIEWVYAVSNDPASGAAFLGSQGDIWDAQKDMLMDILGGLFSLGLFVTINKAEKKGVN